MRRIHFLSCGAVILVASGVSSGALEGCSSSSPETSETPDGGGEDATADASGQDSATADSTTPFDSGPPFSTLDGTAGDTGAGEDAPSTSEDAGEDSGVDAGSDAGQDAGSDAGQDAGSDAGQDAGSDAGQDAGTDAGEDGGASPDAGSDSGPSFTSPVQIGGIPFNANTIVTTATGGAPLAPMDNPGNDNDFATQAEASALSDASNVIGLANNASFPGDGSNIPPVQLGWSNTSNVLNSVVVPVASQTTFEFSVPPAQYQQFQIYATGANGGSTLSYTFTYSTGSPATTTVAIPDWCFPGTLASGEYMLGSSSRVNAGASLTDSDGLQCNIYAIDLNPDPTRVLTEASFTGPATTANKFLVFYGATAW